MSTISLSTIAIDPVTIDLLVKLDDKNIMEEIKEIYYNSDDYLVGKLNNGNYIYVKYESIISYPNPFVKYAKKDLYKFLESY